MESASKLGENLWLFRWSFNVSYSEFKKALHLYSYSAIKSVSSGHSAIYKLQLKCVYSYNDLSMIVTVKFNEEGNYKICVFI